MKVIARDETEHAQLAWDLHHHLMERLTESERLKIHLAQKRALQRVLKQARVDSQREGQPPVHLAEEFIYRLPHKRCTISKSAIQKGKDAL